MTPKIIDLSRHAAQGLEVIPAGQATQSRTTLVPPVPAGNQRLGLSNNHVTTEQAQLPVSPSHWPKQSVEPPATVAAAGDDERGSRPVTAAEADQRLAEQLAKVPTTEPLVTPPVASTTADAAVACLVDALPDLLRLGEMLSTSKLLMEQSLATLQSHHDELHALSSRIAAIEHAMRRDPDNINTNNSTPAATSSETWRTADQDHGRGAVVMSDDSAHAAAPPVSLSAPTHAEPSATVPQPGRKLGTLRDF